MAMNIISKEKKEIKWIGLPTNSAQECQNLEVRTIVRVGLNMCANSGFFPLMQLSVATSVGGETKAVGED